MAGDIEVLFFTSKNERFRQIEIKLEINIVGEENGPFHFLSAPPY